MKYDKNQYTYHGFVRVKERSNICSQEIKRLGYLAVKNGINHSQILPGPLRNFVEKKIASKGKRVKLYRGYVFIFFVNSNRLITCYPIPTKYIDEYNKIIKKKKRMKKG